MIFEEFNNARAVARQKILTLMRFSDYIFYPTGSRYFGNETCTSDWDYFVQVPNPDAFGAVDDAFMELATFLEINGFKVDLVGAEFYADANTVSVWKHDVANIHVQIVKDAKNKQLLQEYLKKQFEMAARPTSRDWDFGMYILQYADSRREALLLELEKMKPTISGVEGESNG